MLEFADGDVEAFSAENLTVPRIRMTGPGLLPSVDIKVGDGAYSYERSFPIKGHSATLPRYLLEQVAEGKSPLLLERSDRFYVYLAK